MKKLMIAAAIVCAAACSEAAVATWTTGTCYLNGVGNALKTKKIDNVNQPVLDSNAMVYLFAGLTLQQYDDLTELGAKGIYGKFDATTGKLTIGETVKGATESGAFTSGKYQFTYSPDLNPNVADYCAVIVTHKDASGNIDYYSANTIAPVGTDMGIDGATKLATYWGEKGAGAATVWYAASDVPEPTSGLLLLLGVAGLALKRKRA